MVNTIRTIKDVNLKGKRILLRTGWDVPLTQQTTDNRQQTTIKVADDFRIRESLPTLKYLIDHRVASITIAFHVDRPEGKVVTDLSVKPVVEKLIELLSQVIFHQNPNVKIPMSNKAKSFNSKTISHSDFGFDLKLGFRILDLKISKFIKIFEIQGTLIPIIILENLRFDPREEANDEQFANELARGHDLYINDAFSNCHRAHASMVAITHYLPAYAGLLVEDELKHLSLLRHNPREPFIVIIGGAKIEDKMAVIDALAKTADAVLLGGKTGLEYAKAIRGLEISKLARKTNSLIPHSLIQKKQNVFPPIDDLDGFDIGPKTTQMFVEKIKTAQTIFWNGNMGMSEKLAYANGTRLIADSIAQSKAKIKIAGGGDTTAFIHANGLINSFTFFSSGGGATLDFLAGKEMPGLEPLVR